MAQAMTEKKNQPTTYVYKKEEGVQKRVGGYKKELTYEERLKQLSKYEPVIPQAPTDMKFHYYKEDGSLGIRAKLKMIESVDELKAFAERCKGQIVGLDTETTGLTFFKDRIVGFSMALNDMEGYYVPIRHQVRHTTKTKENKVDENGNFILTKTGKISTRTVSTHTYEDCPYNLPDKECLDILYKIMLDARVSIWYNSDFDLNMLKGEGYDVMKCKTFDALVLPYIYDAEGRGINGLKDMEKRLLGRYRPGFKETVGSDENFQYTDPTISYEYAATDATSCIAIYQKLYPMVKDLLAQAPSIIELDGKKYNIIQEDNNLVRAFVDYYDHATLKINSQEARDYEKLVKEGLAKTSAEIFEFFGRGPFSLSTGSKEFKGVMADFNIDTGLKTDSGAIAFGKKGIKEFNKNLTYLKNTVFPNMKYMKFNEDKRFGSKLPKKDQQTKEMNVVAYNLTNIIKIYGKPYCKWVDQVNNMVIKNLDGSMATRLDFYNILKNLYQGELKKLDVLKKIQQVSSYNKALNSYIAKLTEVDSCHIHYNVISSTASGRLSSGNGSSNKKSNDYFIGLNGQNLTKPKSTFYSATQSSDTGNILGWKFEPVTAEYAHEHKDDEIIVEAGSPTANIRKCIVAPEGRYVVSMDFCNQEARVLALLSQDPVMLNVFLTNEDMHTTTAVAIFGEAGHDKKYRKIAKAINFSMNYGGSAYSISNTLDIPVEEARGYVEAYNKRYIDCIQWKNREVQKMYQQGGKVYSVFGRPRQFITRLKSASNCGDEKISLKIQSAVERRVVNHEIQSCCGDVCRSILLKLYRKYFKQRDPNIDFISVIHDECIYSINKEVAVDYVRDLQDLMTFTGLNGQFPLDVSMSFGNNMGQQFEFVWKDESRTELVPDRI